MKKSVKIVGVLIGCSILTSFFQNEVKITTPHVYNKQKCDSTEIEHRIASMDIILKNQK